MALTGGLGRSVAYTYYKHASIDRFNPRARAICDRCGLTWNHHDLRLQYEWMGPKKHNTGFMVCPNCMDKEQEQRRQIVVPNDPIPIEWARVEPAVTEMGTLPAGTVPTPYDGDLAKPSNTTNMAALLNPVPPDVTDPTAQNATATPVSSYFSINQDLGVN